MKSTGLKRYPPEYSYRGPLGTLLDMKDRPNVATIEVVDIALHRDGWHEIVRRSV